MKQNNSGSAMKQTNKENAKRPHRTLDTEKRGPDPRFASAEWDPRFGRVPKRAKKAINDARFEGQLKSNPGFRKSSAPVDRFGRPKRDGAKLDRTLREIAERSDDSSSEEEDEIKGVIRELSPQRAAYDGSGDSSDSSDADEELFPNKDEVMEDIPRGQATKRLAVMGLDWSTTRAVDIFASLDSFCPPGKRVEFVEVHPSKFGLERLAVEAKLGPQVVPKSDLEVVKQAREQKLVASDEEEEDAGDDAFDGSGEGSEDDSDASDEDDHDDKLWKSQAALRQYEEERLKYYYGVVQFEDVKAADAVYEQCDGVDYAQSGRSFDLRFIPDEMVIETKPRDRANKLPEGYAPPNVTPSSLNNSHVKLSWDADDPERVILKKKAVGKHELDEENLKAYLAGSSSEDEQPASAADLEKKRNLLLGAVNEERDAGEDDMDMEISFEPGMLEKGEDIVKRKLEKKEHEGETPWEARLRRMEERKAEKRRKRKQSFASENGEEDGNGVAEDTANNPTFDSDPFFSIDHDFDKAEAEQTSSQTKKKSSKSGKTPASAVVEAEAESVDPKRQEAELELLTMNRKNKKSASGRSMSEMLAAVDSDDEDERRSAKKKTRGRRRNQKMASADADKSSRSAMETEDPRFQQVFDSHLYAMDPTHSKFKRDETTKRILAEKMRRNAGDRHASKVGTHVEGAAAATAKEVKQKGDSEAMQLVARIKARAAAKRKMKRRS